MGRFCEARTSILRKTAVYLKKAVNVITKGLLALSLSSVFALSLPLILSPSPCQAYTIEGKIEHVETLPPVEQKFKPGAHFDLSAELSPDNIWVKIPNWLAGSWSARDETAVFFQDFKKGVSRNVSEQFKAKQDFTYGQQIDKNGQIWHYMGVPYTSKSMHTSYEEIHDVKEKSLVRSSEDQAEFRSLYTVLFLDNFTATIQRSQQQESLTTYSPLGDDRIAMTASTKVFDLGGRPQNLQRNEAIIKRYRHFNVINEKDGKDLAALFQQFMAAREQSLSRNQGNLPSAGSHNFNGPGHNQATPATTPVNRPGSDF